MPQICRTVELTSKIKLNVVIYRLDGGEEEAFVRAEVKGLLLHSGAMRPSEAAMTVASMIEPKRRKRGS